MRGRRALEAVRTAELRLHTAEAVQGAHYGA